MGYAHSPNESLASLLTRIVARIPWRPIFQRIPGLWLVFAMMLAVFGPTRTPLLYYTYTICLNYMFLNNNIRTLQGIVHAYQETVKHACTDWLGEYLRKTGASTGDDLSHDMPYDHVLHVIIIPAYMEDLDTLCETLDILASHRRALTQYRICLAMEASEPGSDNKARMLLKLYLDSFFDITFTVHPANLPEEIRGKSSNVSWAAKQMLLRRRRRSTRHEHEIVTVMDADSCFAEDYFSAVAYHYAVASPEQRKIMMFMPSTVFDRNSDRVPIFVRVVDMYWSLGIISNMMHDSKVKMPCSAYSVSMDLCISVEFWDTGPEAIGEDLHMYLKCLFSTRGKLIIKSIFSAVSCCNVEGSYNPVTNDNSIRVRARKWISGFVARYNQAKRHLWGSLDTSYAMRRAVMGMLAPEYENYIQLKNAGISKLGKDDIGIDSNTFSPGVLACLFNRLIEAHIGMGQIGCIGLIRSFMAYYPTLEATDAFTGPLQKPFLQVFGVDINLKLLTTTVLSICTILNFLSAFYYEKYFKFVAFERWALQTLPGNNNRSTLQRRTNAAIPTAAAHGLRFSKAHENLPVYPLGRRPQLSSPRYWTNLGEWILIPYAAVFYFVVPQLNAQMCHLITDRLDYKVAAKPQVRGANCSLATLTMEEVVASAKGMCNDCSHTGGWNDNTVSHAAQVVFDVSSTNGSDCKSATSRGDEGFFEEEH
ncbi:hypothetical protein BC830DRAFT_1066507 [Chytriomyces sp. MP71]|nr:hypothetical protein BC830DRAFT_1066507 [Chytriomyces sp. MP71]